MSTEQVPEGMSLEPIGNMYCPLLVDISIALLQGTPADYLIGGPGLWADVTGTQIKPEHRLYILFCNETQWFTDYMDKDQRFTNTKTTDPFTHYYTCPDYSIGIVIPEKHGLNNIRQEDLRPLNLDCLLKAVQSSASQQGGLFILKPKELPPRVDYSKQGINFRLLPLVQIFTKYYMKIGVPIEEALLKSIYQARCTAHFIFPDSSYYIDFLEELASEPLLYC